MYQYVCSCSVSLFGTGFLAETYVREHKEETETGFGRDVAATGKRTNAAGRKPAILWASQRQFWGFGMERLAAGRRVVLVSIAEPAENCRWTAGGAAERDRRVIRLEQTILT